MAEERGYSLVSPGIYVNRNGEVKIKLRDASNDEGNGVNLAPDSDEITSNMSPSRSRPERGSGSTR